MKRIIVIDGYWSRLLCSILNVSAFTIYNLIFLGCYVNKRDILLHEITHFHQFRGDKWFPIKYLWYNVKYGYWNNPYEIQARKYAQKNHYS